LIQTVQFIFHIKYLFNLFLKKIWVKRKLFDLRILDRPIMMIFFLPKNNKKNSKKNYKFWFSIRFWYREYIERFGLILFNLKFKILMQCTNASVQHVVFQHSPSLSHIYIYIYGRWLISIVYKLIKIVDRYHDYIISSS
jgi:hypothetical protein